MERIRHAGGRYSAAAVGLLLPLLAAGICRANPVIGGIMPPAGQRGGECELTVTGSRLDGAAELFFEDGLIEQLAIEPANGGLVKVRLRIPADCPLGDHRVRLRTPAGLSELRTFAVIDSPVRVEAETASGNKQRNDTAAAAELIELSGGATRTIAGVVRREDVDTYRVQLRTGEKIAASLRAVRLNHTPFDPALELVDTKGFVVASCDDHPLLQQDAMLSTRVATAGDYFLRIRESAYRGDDNCLYLLHVGRFPTPVVALPPGGPPGQSLTVEWLGDCDGPWQTELTLPQHLLRRDRLAEGIFLATARRDGVPAAEGIPLRLTSLPIAREAEPNDTAEGCQTLAAPGAVWGQFQQAGDIDWLRFEAAKGSKWSVRGWGRRLGSPVDLTLNAYRDDDKRQKITGNDDAEGPDSAMTVSVPDEGTFLVRVNDHQDRGGEAFVWWLEVTPIEPAMTVAVPPARTKTQQGLIPQVPRGNRVAVVLNASRTETRADAVPALAHLPPGVQATATPLPADAPSSLVVFEAADDAPLAAAMATVNLVAEHQGEVNPVGGLRQPTELVHGNPNRTCWRQSLSDQLPVAVVEPVPVRVELMPPAVPLVQSGRLDLRVRVERAAGFEGKVRLTFPFRPPGVGAASGVNVSADTGEVVYPINANDKAAIGRWGVAIVATVTPKGEIAKTRPSFEIATRPVVLTIAEPLVQLAIGRAAGEQGSEVVMVGKLPTATEVSAKAMLLGLPARCVAEEISLQPGAAELSFPINIAADAPVGKHGSVVCELHVPHNEDWIIHRFNAGELRIDKPLPAVTRVTKQKPAAEKGTAAQPKPLSRRERLRQQARAIAAASTEPAPGSDEQ